MCCLESAPQAQDGSFLFFKISLLIGYWDLSTSWTLLWIQGYNHIVPLTCNLQSSSFLTKTYSPILRVLRIFMAKGLHFSFSGRTSIAHRNIGLKLVAQSWVKLKDEMLLYHHCPQFSLVVRFISIKSPNNQVIYIILRFWGSLFHLRPMQGLLFLHTFSHMWPFATP